MASLLSHPVAVGALGVLLLNDHVLKVHAPGWVSGKLSDAAGLVVAPLVAAVAVEFITRRRMNWPGLVATTLVVGAGFCAVKVWPLTADAYRAGLGVAQWPVVAVLALPNGGIPGLRPVALSMDVSDLVTLPCLLIPLALASRNPEQIRPSRAAMTRLQAVLLAAASLALVATSYGGPTVYDTYRADTIDLTAERPGFEQQIVLVATAEAVSGGGVANTSASVSEPLGGNEYRTAENVSVAVARVTDRDRLTNVESEFDVDTGTLTWSPFADCPGRAECVEVYLVSVTWTDPQVDPLSVVTEYTVGIHYELEQTVPPGAAVMIRFGT